MHAARRWVRSQNAWLTLAYVALLLLIARVYA